MRNAVSRRDRLEIRLNLINLSGSGSDGCANFLQVVGDHAPNDPTLETNFAVIETTVQIIATFENRDTPFDTGVPSANSAEPGLFLSLATLLRFLAGFGKHNSLDTSALGFSFIVGRENAAVGTSLGRWLPKALLMGIQAGDPLIPVAGVALEDFPAGDDTTFDFVDPDLAAILNRLSGFASTDNGGITTTVQSLWTDHTS